MTMRSGAKILGIIGGIIGLIIGIFTVMLGSFVGMFMTEAIGEEAAGVGASALLWGIGVFVFAIVGLVGGIMTRNKPLPAGILMLIGGVGGFIALSLWLVPGILLIIGAVLALASTRAKA